MARISGTRTMEAATYDDKDIKDADKMAKFKDKDIKERMIQRIKEAQQYRALWPHGCHVRGSGGGQVG